MMYDKIKTIGQKESNEHKVTAIDKTDSLTNPPKMALRNAHAKSPPFW